MKCPLCDMEFGEDLVSHLDNEHKELGYYCEPCHIRTSPFSSLVKHFGTEGHLYRTGKLRSKLIKMQDEVKELNVLLAKRTKQVVEIQEILRKRD